MSRNLMPKSGAMAPYVVVNRDAAVAGVFSVDGERGAIDLTTKYVQITAYNQKIGTIEEDITTIEGQITLINQSIGSLNTAVQGHTTAIDGINTSIGTINTSLAGKAAKGANNDILELNAITKAILISQGGTGVKTQAEIWPAIRPVGSTPLGGDPVNPYDAATKRWVENLVGAGSTGPTMNGVMNFGVGTPTLWTSRAFIPPYALPGDGQLVNRADWPELWAHAQQHGPITDAAWLADKTKRAAFSTGNGTTTFRLPDLNGVQAGSLVGLYGRGDAGGGYVIQSVLENGAPNITGGFTSGAQSALIRTMLTPVGAISLSSNSLSTPVILTGSTGTNTDSNRFAQLSFDASASNAAYGRASDVRPNTWVGVWIIRASGGFTATNTNWSITNGDTVLPPVGTQFDGGRLQSLYQAAGVTEAEGTFRILGSRDATYAARIGVTNITKGISSGFDFYDNGNAKIPGNLSVSSLNATNRIGVTTNGETIRIVSPQGQGSYIMAYVADTGLTADRRWYVGNGGADNTVTLYNSRTSGGVLLNHDGSVIIRGMSDGTGSGSFRSFTINLNGTLTGPLGTIQQTASDIELKADVYESKKGALERINAIGSVEFNWAMDGRRDRGFIAQQLAEIDPLYTFRPEGTEYLNYSQTALMADTFAAIQELTEKNKNLETALAAQQVQMEEMRAMIQALMDK